MYLKRKLHGVSATEIFFYNSDLTVSTPLIMYSSLYCPINYHLGETILSSREGTTLLNSLDISSEEIMQQFSRTVRNEVRHAQKDGVRCYVYQSKELLNNFSLLEDFEGAYKKMHQLKGMSHTNSIPYLRALAKHDALIMTAVTLEEMTVAWHCYVVGDGIARLLYSVSSFRENEESSWRNAIGRANRLLHYEDMLWFKNEEYHTYDWGGYGQTDDVKSISEFKASFGGHPQKTYFAVTTSKWWMRLLWNMRTIQKHE